MKREESMSAQVASAERGEEGTDELPSSLGDVRDAVNGLHVDWVADNDFWRPDGAQKVSPVSSRGLLERSSFSWTENA